MYVCMFYVSVYVCMYVLCMYVRIYVCIMNVCMYYVYTCVCKYVCVCMYVCMYGWMYVRMESAPMRIQTEGKIW